MFTVYVGSILTMALFILSRSRHAPRAVRRVAVVHSGRFGVAVVHGVVRQFRRGDGRRPRQGPGRRPAPRPARGFGEEVSELLPSLTLGEGQGVRAANPRKSAIANCKLQVCI